MARRTYDLEPGERDCPVTIEQFARVIDEGFPVHTWTVLHQAYWCARHEVRADERFSADQVTTPFLTRWEGPYVDDMDPEVVDVPNTLRLIYRGRRHDIKSASIIRLQEGIELFTIASTSPTVT